MRRLVGTVLSLAPVTLFCFVGCGSSSEDQSKLSALPKREKITLAVMGGNTSCGTADGQPSPFGTTLYGPLLQLVDSIARTRGEEPRYLISCHTSASTLYFATSDAPDRIYAAPIEETAKLVDELTGDDGRLFVAGHSYGGWLALQTVLAARQPVEGLTSIDPISRNTCTFTNPFGCTSFPGDVSAGQRGEIARRTERWANFYQNHTWYLRATATPEADANVLVGAPHVGIETTQDVWVEIASQIDVKLAADLLAQRP